MSADKRRPCDDDIASQEELSKLAEQKPTIAEDEQEVDE